MSLDAISITPADAITRGQVWESRDPRAHGRRVRVLRENGYGKWRCEVLPPFRSKGRRNETTIHGGTLLSKWRIVDAPNLDNP